MYSNGDLGTFENYEDYIKYLRTIIVQTLPNNYGNT